MAERVPGEDLTVPSRNVHTYEWWTLPFREVSNADVTLRLFGLLFRSSSVGSHNDAEVEGKTSEGVVVKQEADVRGE